MSGFTVHCYGEGMFTLGGLGGVCVCCVLVFVREQRTRVSERHHKDTNRA